MSASEDDESVGVQVFALIQRRARWIYAVEPAAMLGIVEVPLQGAEQRGRVGSGIGR